MKRPKFTQGIYLIANWVERKCYVGSSVRMEIRLSGHRSSLMRGKHHSKRLQADWDRLGAKAFQFIHWEQVSDLSELSARERFWIERFEGQKHYNSGVPGDRVYITPLQITGIKTAKGWIRRGDRIRLKRKEETVKEIYLHRSPFSCGKFGASFWCSRAHMGGNLKRFLEQPEKYYEVTI